MATDLDTMDNVASATECQMKCILSKLCKIFNFYPDKGVCVLGSEVKPRFGVI